MSFLNTKHKRKSAVITSILMLLLLYWIVNFGMRYLDPPLEYGLAINYGNSNIGSGKSVQKTKTQPLPQKEEIVEKKVLETPKEIVKEDIITDDTNKETPVIEKSKEKKEPVKETPKKEEIVEKPKPKPSEETKNALNNLFNKKPNNTSNSGKGDDVDTGVKGNEKGDPNANKYYGNSGSGSGGNYNLAGRNALSKPIENPDCQEEGTVVVSIEVDNSGKVIRAVAGVKGTTNTAPCLLAPAKQAALKTTWNADVNAPSKQRGTIIYKFSLSK